MSTQIAPDCTNCTYSKWDQVWGEWKCLYYSRRLKNYVVCEHYVLETKEKNLDEIYEKFE